ncbi:MAG: HupE/UreJ family protein [Verrucomicrobiota bacterium]
MKFARFFACLLFLAGLMPALRAHQVASVELEFLKLDDEWRLEGEMDIAYMLPETRNVPGGPPMSRAAAMKAPPEELARIRKETENTLRKLITITFADQTLAWRVEFPDFEKDPFELPPEAGDIALVTTRLLIDAIPGPGELRVHWAGEQETELIILTEEGEAPDVVSTLPGGSLMLLRQTGTGKSAPVEKPVTGGWLQSGFRHVLGIDHIFFILGLFLLIPKWKPLMVQSLLFTLAHSITLGLAVFNLLHVPGKWVEALIALSIAWVGIENLIIRSKLGRQRMLLVFCFGLLHGLGFASVLADKLKGLSGSQLVGPLLGFNVGVELAQITILAAAFLLIRPLGKYTFQVQTLGSAFIGLAGIAWVIQLLFFPGSPLF